MAIHGLEVINEANAHLVSLALVAVPVRGIHPKIVAPIEDHSVRVRGGPVNLVVLDRFLREVMLFLGDVGPGNRVRDASDVGDGATTLTELIASICSS